MKITKTASGKQIVKMSKAEWLEIGKIAGFTPSIDDIIATLQEVKAFLKGTPKKSAKGEIIRDFLTPIAAQLKNMKEKLATVKEQNQYPVANVPNANMTANQDQVSAYRKINQRI